MIRSNNFPLTMAFTALKSLVVSLIFLPLAALILVLPMVRLVVPVWPHPVEERLNAEGRPVLSLVDSTRSSAGPRSRPVSAAVFDRVEGGYTIGYVVGLRDAAGAFLAPPAAPLWWPELELAECSLGVSVERVLDWQACDAFLRVHHPNRMTTLARLKLALDRLRVPPSHRTETKGG